MLRLIKFGSSDCPACQDMSRFDEAVARSLGVDFAVADLKNFEIYEQYRRIIPVTGALGGEVSLPTYLLVHDADGDFCIQGELIGPMSIESFDSALSSLVNGMKFDAIASPGKTNTA